MAEKKRGNGEGSKPRKRPDGRWEARYYSHGKRKTVYGKTRKEVAGKLAQALTTKDDAPVFEPTTITVREFFTEYENAVRDAMKRRSFETYQSIKRKHLLSAFGSSKLIDLNRQQVQRMYTRKIDAGLSPARVKRIHGVLSSALNMAIRWRYLEHNVCREVSPPRVPPPEIRPLSLEEAKRFLKASEEDEQYHALYVLGVTSGARWGELAAISWDRLDLKRGTMRIERSLIKGKGGYSFDTPKTKTSRRGVILTRRAVEALELHRNRQQAAGQTVEGDALVFTNTVGQPVNHSHFSRRHFKPLLKRANLPDTSWHAATRHTCTCILLLEGVNPKSVAMQMGWSSVGFMFDTYAQYMPGWGDNGVMDAALG